jgi:hypothetical protein
VHPFVMIKSERSLPRVTGPEPGIVSVATQG